MLKSRWTMLWMVHSQPKCPAFRAQRIAWVAILAAFAALTTPPCWAQDQPAPKKLAQEEQAKEVPEPLTKYLGRRIALPMSYHGIPWLNRLERIQEENPEEMLAQLGVKPGMSVCDMGCGDGYYTIELAKRVGPTGKVIAVDIQPEMLQELSRRCEKSDLKNVEMILGEPHDPKLPVGQIDVILMVDVYHEFSNPVEMLDAMRKSLKPDGRIALVEFRGEDPQVPIKPEHKMTKKQILKEYEANAMRLVGQYDRLPWQHLMFLGPEPQEKSPKQPKPE